jgi:hypothetical protein
VRDLAPHAGAFALTVQALLESSIMTKTQMDPTIARKLTEHGFSVVQTGGNCTAWAYSFSHDWFVLITSESDPSHELLAGEPVDIGVYDANGDQYAFAHRANIEALVYA